MRLTLKQAPLSTTNFFREYNLFFRQRGRVIGARARPEFLRSVLSNQFHYDVFTLHN